MSGNCYVLVENRTRMQWGERLKICERFQAVFLHFCTDLSRFNALTRVGVAKSISKVFVLRKQLVLK